MPTEACRTLGYLSPRPLIPCQDGVHTPWESVLDAPAYSIRVRREELPSLITILRAIPPSQVRSMQDALSAVWPRFSYMGVVAAEEARQSGRTPTSVVSQAAEHDATATLLQVLKARLLLREARRAGGHTAKMDSRPAGGCVEDPAGGESHPADGFGPERDFEGRRVNGWTI
uniref:Uncharacterized protein n=1 Tax=Haptolina brevifila TaxID=156173 RepID=A0A7S2D7H4_9EUKA|mmetsp:Transcript_34004/g.67710  ORF Transcript_34004/g.67710 Transcript_34004/m.67710 type:complete len:172 (+) Transcript_34004:601-1116(+)